MIHLHKDGDIMTAVMDGPLNAAGVDRLRKALQGQLSGVRHLVLDAGGTDTIDNEGLRYLQLLDERMLNIVDGTFRLVHLGERLRDAMYTDDWSDLLAEDDPGW